MNRISLHCYPIKKYCQWIPPLKKIGKSRDTILLLLSV
jgi:hypothetical protein